MSRKTVRLHDKTVRQREGSQTRALAAADSSRPVFGAALPAGAMVGEGEQYRVIRVLAQQTGEADVYLCHGREGDEPFAVKIYRGSQGAKDDVLRVLASVRHDDIINLIEYGVWQGHLYEVMELARGGSLGDRLPQQPFSESELAEIVLPQVVNALELCHGMAPRIIHRDLKPTNIFFRDEAGRDVVIGDFGIASLLAGDDTHRVTTSSRSPDYAAPEVYSGQIGIEADYYALGITLAELCAGHSPWRGRSELQVMHGNVSEAVPLADTIPPRLRQLIEGLTVKERRHRWGAAQVRQWLAGGDVPVWRETTARAAHPYALPNGAEVRTAVEMASAIRRHGVELKPDIARGHVSRWFATFDQSLARRLGELEDSGLGPDLLTFAFIYVLDPLQPLSIGDRSVRSPKDLAQLIDSDAEARVAALELLQHGYLTQWLMLVGYGFILERWLSLPDASREEPAVALEALLRLMDPELPPPGIECQVDGDAVDFGRVEEGERRSLRVLVEPVGRGYLAGVARLAVEIPGVTLSTHIIRGRTEIVVHLDAGPIAAGARAETTLEIDTNADRRITLPLRFEVAMPLLDSARDCARWAAAGAAIFAGARLLLSWNGHHNWLGSTYDYLSVRSVVPLIERGDLAFRFEFVALFSLAVAPLLWWARRTLREL